MLIGNYSVYNKLPLKYCTGPNSATAGGFGSQSNYVESGRVRSRMMQSETTTALELYALPNGGYPSLTWFIPQNAGGIGSSNQIYGAGTSAVNLAGGLSADASLTGAGDITSAAAQLIIDMVASLAGDGTVSSADLRGFLDAVANLSGSGDLTATAAALAWMQAATDGSGSITSATPYATGNLSADIFSFSALTPEGISNAVWAQIIEAGYSSSDMLKLIAASAAGKLSGSPSSPIQITGVDGSTVRIDATVDGSGNRTAVTYNVS